MDIQTGIVCGLTDAKPTFESSCPDFQIDKEKAEYQVELERKAAAAETEGGGFTYEKKGIEKGMLGGIIMIAIAVIWFVVGLAAGRIFFYPPILFCIGLYSLIRGAATGNVAGKRK